MSSAARASSDADASDRTATKSARVVAKAPGFDPGSGVDAWRPLRPVITATSPPSRRNQRVTTTPSAPRPPAANAAPPTAGPGGRRKAAATAENPPRPPPPPSRSSAPPITRSRRVTADDDDASPADAGTRGSSRATCAAPAPRVVRVNASAIRSLSRLRAVQAFAAAFAFAAAGGAASTASTVPITSNPYARAAPQTPELSLESLAEDGATFAVGRCAPIVRSSAEEDGAREDARNAASAVDAVRSAVTAARRGRGRVAETMRFETVSGPAAARQDGVARQRVSYKTVSTVSTANRRDGSSPGVAGSTARGRVRRSPPSVARPPTTWSLIASLAVASPSLATHDANRRRE